MIYEQKTALKFNKPQVQKKKNSFSSFPPFTLYVVCEN